VVIDSSFEILIGGPQVRRAFIHAPILLFNILFPPGKSLLSIGVRMVVGSVLAGIIIALLD
jgi:hypothetical protein